MRWDEVSVHLIDCLSSLPFPIISRENEAISVVWLCHGWRGWRQYITAHRWMSIRCDDFLSLLIWGVPPLSAGKIISVGKETYVCSISFFSTVKSPRRGEKITHFKPATTRFELIEREKKKEEGETDKEKTNETYARSLTISQELHSFNHQILETQLSFLIESLRVDRTILKKNLSISWVNQQSFLSRVFHEPSISMSLRNSHQKKRTSVRIKFNWWSWCADRGLSDVVEHYFCYTIVHWNEFRVCLIGKNNIGGGSRGRMRMTQHRGGHTVWRNDANHFQLGINRRKNRWHLQVFIVIGVVVRRITEC